MTHVYLDLETNGYNGLDILSKYNRIIQIGALCIDFEFETFVNPGVPITRQSTNIHKITDDDVKSAPTFEIAWCNFLEKIGNRKCFLIAHGGKFFDRVMIIKELYRFGMVYNSEQFTFVDTDPIFRSVLPYAQSHNLGNMVRTYNPDYNFSKEHTALADCKALCGLICHLGIDIEKYQTDYSNHGFKKVYELNQYKWLLKEFSGVETTDELAKKLPSFVVYKWIKDNVPGITEERTVMALMRIYDFDVNTIRGFIF
jgi:DNA polymerase III epsilon subunit-like protein